MSSGPAPADWRELTRAIHHAIGAERVAPRVQRCWDSIVAPAERSFFYLVEGDVRDCLIDGGWGLAATVDSVRSNPRKPLVAIATHSHFDHIGLLHQAEICYGHAAEAEIFADPQPITTQALPYLDGRAALVDGRTLDPASIRQTPCPLDMIVGDGDHVDLGGCVLTVLHTPGHSPGSLTILDEREGLLYPADTVHDGHIWDDIPGADIGRLLASHRRLADVDFARALPGHGAILDRPAFLARIERYARDAARLDAHAAKA